MQSKPHDFLDMHSWQQIENTEARKANRKDCTLLDIYTQRAGDAKGRAESPVRPQIHHPISSIVNALGFASQGIRESIETFIETIATGSTGWLHFELATVFPN